MAADREEERDQNLVTASRVFAALARRQTEAGEVAVAISEVFPWARHLSSGERAQVAGELIAALSDAAELVIDSNAREVIAGWWATARIKAEHRGRLRPRLPQQLAQDSSSS